MWCDIKLASACPEALGKSVCQEQGLCACMGVLSVRRDVVEYRYHRMVENIGGWTGPVPNRLGKSADYLGETGFGHEDWNFSRDIWSDGKVHLYLRSKPAKADLDKTFNIVLGVRRSGGNFAVGFCQNAHYSVKNVLLGDVEKLARAEQLHQLDKLGHLHGGLKGLSIEELVRHHFSDGEVSWVAVDDGDLIKLEVPVRIDDDIVKSNFYRYVMPKLTAESYERLFVRALNGIPTATEDEKLFPEGTLVARTHLQRERDPQVVKEAKNRFEEKHGSLSCEACSWAPATMFGAADLAGKIIEAHHDIPLGSNEHKGVTNSNDIRMLCPNCHRTIHSLRPWLKVADFKMKFFPQK